MRDLWNDETIAEHTTRHDVMRDGESMLPTALAIRLIRRIRDRYRRRIETLEAQLAEVLEVTVERGETLGYEDETYHKWLDELQGTNRP
jgi:hypothetical protein